MDPTSTCHHCERSLRIGEDIISLQHGVIGPRGVIPLDDAFLLCSNRCLRASFDRAPPGPERIP